MLNEEFLVPSKPAIPWPPRLPFDFAMGEEPDALLLRYNLTPDQFQYLCLNSAFIKEVADHKVRIVEDGITFKYKAKLQAEEYLMEIDNIIHDPETSPAVRLDAIKSTVKWAGYEPKESASASSAGPTRMVISWADGSGQIALETP